MKKSHGTVLAMALLGDSDVCSAVYGSAALYLGALGVAVRVSS